MDFISVWLQTSKMLKSFTASSAHGDRRSAAVVCERYNDTNSEEKLEEAKMQALTCFSELCNMGANLSPPATPCLRDMGIEEINRSFCTQASQRPWRSNKTRVSILSQEQHVSMCCSHFAILIRVSRALGGLLVPRASLQSSFTKC